MMTNTLDTIQQRNAVKLSKLRARLFPRALTLAAIDRLISRGALIDQIKRLFTPGGPWSDTRPTYRNISFGTLPGESDTLARIRTMATRGMGYEEIASTLNTLGIKGRRGKSWHPLTIKRILN